jgi:hypothetical protein
MKARSVIKKALHGFKIEDEIHLAFQYGYTIDKNHFLRNRPTRFRSIFLNCILFLARIFRRVSIKELNNLEEVEFFVYVGSVNQFRSLQSTIQSLDNHSLRYSVVYVSFLSSKVSLKERGFEPLRFRIIDVLSSSFLFFVRVKDLYLSLKNLHNFSQVKKFFDKFCMSYFYLPRFLYILSKKNPRYVITSNDHCVDNRCLMLAARLLNVKTIFMQHGSGSTMLPPLEFDFAFLDGEKSVKKYIECNKIERITKKNYITCNVTIFLSGVKKKCSIVNSTSDQFTIGVAINPFDNIRYVIDLIEYLISINFHVSVRAHPAQVKDDLEILAVLSEKRDRLCISEFNFQSTGEFLSDINFLIANKSGIHTEAAVSGRATYYFEFGKSEMSKDMYGHLEGGLVKEFPINYTQLTALEIRAFSDIDENTRSNIKKFSESFSSKWQGREGDLVVETLTRYGRESLSDIYSIDKNSLGFKSIYRLAD